MFENLADKIKGNGKVAAPKANLPMKTGGGLFSDLAQKIKAKQNPVPAPAASLPPPETKVNLLNPLAIPKAPEKKIVTTEPFNNAMLRKDYVAPVPVPTLSEQPIKPDTAPKGIVDLAKRTVASTASQVADTAKFGLDYVAKRPAMLLNKLAGVPVLPENSFFANKLDTAVEKKYEQVNQAGLNPVRNVQASVKDFSDKVNVNDPEWERAPLSEKLTTKLPETIYNIAPSIAGSLIPYLAGPQAGFAVSAGSVAEDVKEKALKSGVNPRKAEELGLVTGLAVGYIDKIVPGKQLEGAAKEEFTKGFLKRLAKTSFEEAGTEVAQENIQLAAEATFRDDLGWDEVKTRNAMSALGGLLGGAGINGAVDIAYNGGPGSFSGILDVNTAKPKVNAETSPIADLDPAKMPDTLTAEQMQAFHDQRITPEALAQKPNTIPVAELKNAGTNLRVSHEDIARARDAVDNGTMQPIEIERRPDGSIWLKDGSHRLSAMKAAGIKNIPVVDTTPKVELKPEAMPDTLTAEQVQTYQAEQAAKPVQTAPVAPQLQAMKQEKINPEKGKSLFDIVRDKQIENANNGFYGGNLEQKQARLKGNAMEMAAIDRKLRGVPTAIEIRNAQNYLESNHSGKKVQVNGEDVTLTGKVAFGRPEAERLDGSKFFVSASEISTKKINREDVMVFLKTQAEKQLRGKADLYGIKETVLPVVPQLQEAVQAEPRIELNDSPLHNKIMGELVSAEAGKRIMNGDGLDATFTGSKSTFPQWIPSELRRKPLLDAVSRHITEGTMPTKAAEKRLYQVVYDEMNAQNDVLNDAKFIEQQRQNLFDPFASAEENAAALAKFDEEYAKLKTSQPGIASEGGAEIQGVGQPIQAEVATQETVNQPAAAETITEQTKLVPRDEKMESAVFKRLQAEDPNVDGEATYTRKNQAEQTSKAIDLVATDKNKAYRIAMGIDETPNDLTSTVVNIALAEKAREEGNYKLYSELVVKRSLEQTRRGQEIVAEKGSVSDNSLATYTKKLIAARLEKVGEKYTSGIQKQKNRKKSSKSLAMEVIENQAVDLGERVNKAKEFNLAEVQSFIDSLAC